MYNPLAGYPATSDPFVFQQGPMTLSQAIINSATRLGISPLDLATAISYETAGTFDQWKAGPTTHWGQHFGLIQWGGPQRKQYGVYEGMPVDEQMAAVENYLVNGGLKPGMGLPEIYSIINAGSLTKNGKPRLSASDRPGWTVAKHVQEMMGGHRQKAASLLGGQFTPEAAATGAGPILRKGARGEPVAALQTDLAAKGFDPGPIDGIFGNRTRGAVRAFQASTGLEADGVVGPLTYGQLNPPPAMMTAEDEGTAPMGTVRIPVDAMAQPAAEPFIAPDTIQGGEGSDRLFGGITPASPQDPGNTFSQEATDFLRQNAVGIPQRMVTQPIMQRLMQETPDPPADFGELPSQFNRPGFGPAPSTPPRFRYDPQGFPQVADASGATVASPPRAPEPYERMETVAGWMPQFAQPYAMPASDTRSIPTAVGVAQVPRNPSQAYNQGFPGGGYEDFLGGAAAFPMEFDRDAFVASQPNKVQDVLNKPASPLPEGVVPLSYNPDYPRRSYTEAAFAPTSQPPAPALPPKPTQAPIPYNDDTLAQKLGTLPPDALARIEHVRQSAAQAGLPYIDIDLNTVMPQQQAGPVAPKPVQVASNDYQMPMGVSTASLGIGSPDSGGLSIGAPPQGQGPSSTDLGIAAAGGYPPSSVIRPPPIAQPAPPPQQQVAEAPMQMASGPQGGIASAQQPVQFGAQRGSGGILGLLGGKGRNPASLIPSSSGSGPYGEDQVNSWVRGPTNALGGSEGLHWTSSTGRPVTAVENNWGSGYFTSYG